MISLLVMIGLVIFTNISCLFSRKVNQKYGADIIDYKKFLFNFRETPRSKFAKKYRSPMEPLVEENSILDSTSMFSALNNKRVNSMFSINDDSENDDCVANRVSKLTNINARNSL